MIKTFITGSSGFIGRRLYEKLDDPTRLPPVAIPHESIVNGCSRNGEQLFFLSTYGNMAHHTNHGAMIKANVTQMMYILEQFRGWFCYMSSSSVTLPVQTPYSRTKRAAEEILQALPELKSCIVRPYSVTGVGEQKEHLIPTLIRSCMEGEEMPFDPYPVHDFIDVNEVVTWLIQLADEQHTGIVELGSGACYTNEAVLHLVEEVTGHKANVKEKTGLRPYDNRNWRCQNPYKIPRITLVQSVIQMVEAYKREHT